MFLTKINYFWLGGTDTNLFCVDLRSVGLVGSKAEKVLEDISIAVNKNACPGDKSALNPSGIRIGTPALTSRSFTVTDMDQVAEFIHQGFQLALEINKAAGGTTVKDFKEKMHDVVFQEKIKEIKENVEKFAVEFRMPGLDDM
jgi:glycine hydroxymethyltransferase